MKCAACGFEGPMAKWLRTHDEYMIRWFTEEYRPFSNKQIEVEQEDYVGFYICPSCGTVRVYAYMVND